MACGNGSLIGDAQKRRTRTPHLLLQEPGRRVWGLAFERVGANQFAEFDGPMRRGEPRSTVDEGTHFMKVDFTAEAGRSQCGFGAGESTADDANPHCDPSDSASEKVFSARELSAPASFSNASPVTRTLRHVSMKSAPIAR